MSSKSRINNINRKLVLTITLCIAVVLCAGALYFNVGDTGKIQEVYAATSSPDFTLENVKIYDTNKGNTSSVTVSPSSLAYSDTYDYAEGSDISASISDNKVKIESTSNLHYEACYADVIASITVPAWREYQVVYTISSSIIRTNSSATNGTGCEIYDFDGDAQKGSDVGFIFSTSQGATTTPAQFVKSITYSTNNSEHKETYSTLTLTYSNASNKDVIYKHNFGVFAYCRATISNNSKITATFDFSSTVQDEKLTVTKPTEDLNEYAYTGNPQTYAPVGWDANKMSITEDSDSMSQTNAGTYTIKIKPQNSPWDDMTYDVLTFTFEIKKAKPNVQPQYEQKSARYVTEGLPVVTNIAGGVAGTFSWGAQTPSIEQREYTWIFTPDDTDNYEVQTGKETIIFVAPEIKDIFVNVNDGDVIYDAFDMEEIKKHLTVTAQYEDDSEKILSNEAYEVRTPDGTLTAGETEITISVWDGTYDADGNKNTIKKKVVIQVAKAVIESLDVYCSTTFTYPVTKEQILAALEVESDWNYTNRPVKITDKSVLELEGDIQAGRQIFTVTYKGTDLSKDITLTIYKGTYDMSGIVFEDMSFDYDGEAHSIEIQGSLPDGVSVSYENNGKTEIGNYTVTAKFSHEEPNYNDIEPMTATLEIKENAEEPTEPDVPVTPIEPNEPTSPEEPGNNDPTPGNNVDFDKVLDILKQWWQVIASVASIVLIIIFVAKGASYASKKKENKRTVEGKYNSFYVAGLFGLSMTNWTIIASVLMGLAVLSFVFMLLEKRGYKKSQRILEDAKDEYARNREEMMYMRIMGGNANVGGAVGQQSYAYAQPAIGIEDMRGMINEAVSAMLPNVQQYLPQQASTNDELVQRLLEQNAQNEDRIEKFLEKLAEQPTKREFVDDEAIDKLVKKLSEQQSVEKVAENEVATTTVNVEIIEELKESIRKEIQTQMIATGEKSVEEDNNAKKIEMLVKTNESLMRNQEMLMKQIVELSANRNNEKQVVLPIMQQPSEKVVERIVEKPVEKIIEKEIIKEVHSEEKVAHLHAEKSATKAKTAAPRLTLDEAYEKLSAKQKKFFDTLKAYALSKDKCKEKKSTYYILLGQSSVNPLVKLTIKKDTTVALFKMEDEFMK
ncbi:MAG: hypothetical protein K2J89_04735, partial [Clostridia bacterium]|nr:hypothetical protein [Clostridia bacterium]